MVNAGIGGNQVIGPAEYSPQKPFPGGPSASDRLDRDVLSLSGVAAVIWLEGINDFSRNGNAIVEAVEAGMSEVVGRIARQTPRVRMIGATVTSALGSTSADHGSPEQDAKRKALNEFIRGGGLFDGVIDFDAATLDPQTGGMRAEFVPESTTGGPGDKLHPNRVGYLSMGSAIDLNLFATIPVTGSSTRGCHTGAWVTRHANSARSGEAPRIRILFPRHICFVSNCYKRASCATVSGNGDQSVEDHWPDRVVYIRQRIGHGRSRWYVHSGQREQHPSVRSERTIPSSRPSSGGEPRAAAVKDLATTAAAPAKPARSVLDRGAGR